MFANASNNQFQFSFPRTFIPDEIVNVYKPYMDRIPGNMMSEPIDLLNYGIQTVQLPETGFEPVEQGALIGRKKMYRSSISKVELQPKEFTITMKQMDGFITYWMMLDILNYYYATTTIKPYLPDGTILNVLDYEGYSIVTIIPKRLVLKGISNIEMSFSNNAAEYQTFDVNFVYNEIEIQVDLGN